MKLRVWVDNWQMQCCGEPFEVGSVVQWKVGPIDRHLLGSLLGDASIELDAVEDHHGLLPKDSNIARGTVESIEAIYCKRATRPDGPPKTLYAVDGSGVLQSRTRATGWDDNAAGTEGLSFEGYLVVLNPDLVDR